MAALISLFPHFYALRIPILLAVTLAGLPALSFWTDAEPMLAGLYDIAPTGMLVLTMLNFIAAWTLLMTSWMILAYAPARLKCAALFEAPSQPPSLWFIWSAALALPNIVTAIVHSRRASDAALVNGSPDLERAPAHLLPDGHDRRIGERSSLPVGAVDDQRVTGDEARVR